MAGVTQHPGQLVRREVAGAAAAHLALAAQRLEGVGQRVDIGQRSGVVISSRSTWSVRNACSDQLIDACRCAAELSWCLTCVAAASPGRAGVTGWMPHLLTSCRRACRAGRSASASPGPYTPCCAYYKAFAMTLKRSMRQHRRAGEKLFIDDAGATLALADGTRAHIFVAAMGGSSYKPVCACACACATADQSMRSWLITSRRLPHNPERDAVVAEPLKNDGRQPLAA